jgi:hypothetical protein
LLSVVRTKGRKLDDQRSEEQSAPGLALVEVVLGAGASREVEGSSRRVDDTYCLPVLTGRRCVGAEERLAYVRPGLRLDL